MNHSLIHFLASSPTNVESFDQRGPLIHDIKHGIQPLSCPPCIEAALLSQFRQMTAGDVQPFATNVHLVLAAGTFAVREVKTRGQFPVPLRIHAVGQAFGMVISVVK